jgi:hypothetical protein
MIETEHTLFSAWVLEYVGHGIYGLYTALALGINVLDMYCTFT